MQAGIFGGLYYFLFRMRCGFNVGNFGDPFDGLRACVFNIEERFWFGLEVRFGWLVCNNLSRYFCGWQADQRID